MFTHRLRRWPDIDRLLVFAAIGNYESKYGLFCYHTTLSVE